MMYECDICRLDIGNEGGMTTVSAGEAATELGACGYAAQSLRLPRIYAADQSYTVGLCPGLSLEKGTMFPELISEY